MRLNVDLSLLWANASSMGAKKSDFVIERRYDDSELALDAELASGKEIQLEDLDRESGLLSIGGRQVILYIPHPGYKYHVADCSTLETMRLRRRFERYKVTNNVTGSFEMNVTNWERQRGITSVVRLDVCRNCLLKLNYDGYRTGNKKGAFANFDLAVFFSQYSSVFRFLPKVKFESEVEEGYVADWNEISKEFRHNKGYRCESCCVDLKRHRSLLHTHHKNREKQDNRQENLEALCADCHRKAPFHGGMGVPLKSMKILTRLRREQGFGEKDGWEKVFSHADPACDGVLKVWRSQRKAVPEIGYEVLNSDGEVFAELELAWPRTKQGVYIKMDSQSLTLLNKLGWRVTSLDATSRSVLG
jgi:hypothetical protein